MRHRAPRHLLLLRFLRLHRGSRLLLAGRRRAGWLIANQKARLTLAMASIMVLACAAIVTATEIPDDDSVTATDVPSHAPQPLRSRTAEQVSRSSGRTPLELPAGSATQETPDRQAPGSAGPLPGSDGLGVPSEDPEDRPATPGEPAPSAPTEPPSRTPSTDAPDAGLDASSPPSLALPMSAPPGSHDPDESPSEEPTDESSGSESEGEDGSGSDSGEEPAEQESSTPTPRDRTAPETEIVSSPTVGGSAVAESEFEFTANESATFRCSLDGQPYVPCGSPTEYGELSPGLHTFAVQATDAAGDIDPSPAQRRWLTTGANAAPLVGEVSPSEDSLLP